MHVNKKRLSELLGISEPTLTQYQREGMPLIAKGSRGKENEYDVAAVIAWFKNRLQAERSQQSSGDLNYEVERTRLTKAQADKQELDLAARRGELVDVSDVRKHWQQMVFAAKAKLLAIPVKAAPAVITAQSTAEVFELLTAMIREALDELSETGAPQCANEGDMVDREPVVERDRKKRIKRAR